MYVYVYTHTCVYLSIYIYIYMHTCIYVYVYDYNILFYTMLYYIVLHYIILYYIIFYSIIAVCNSERVEARLLPQRVRVGEDLRAPGLQGLAQ